VLLGKFLKEYQQEQIGRLGMTFNKLVLGSRDCIILRIMEKCGEQGETTVIYSFQLSGKLKKFGNYGSSAV
jgi:hypothetical protein